MARPWSASSIADVAPPLEAHPYAAPARARDNREPIVFIARKLRTDGFAIASLVLGILWLYWLGSILALVFGYLSLGRIKRAPHERGGRGLAIAGIVLGWVGVATLLTLVIALRPSL